MKLQFNPLQVAPRDAHLQLLSAAVPLSKHEPSSKPDRPAVFASTHVKEPELLWQTWLPHSVPGQSLSVLQVVCAWALPATNKPTRTASTDHRTFAAPALTLDLLICAHTTKSDRARQATGRGVSTASQRQ